jgi:hypothetical protein
VDKFLVFPVTPVPAHPANSLERAAARPESARGETGSRSKRYADALEQLLTHRGDPSVEVGQILADHPDFVAAHGLRSALIVCADAIGRRSLMASSLAAIEAVCPDATAPARRHAAAARAWFEGDSSRAAELYGAIVVDQPRDALALAVAHALDFRLGRRRMMLDRIAQVLPEWSSGMPGYASILAMYAFALEENGQLRRAKQLGRRALAIDPGHPGALHVLAHVLEMQGRVREGLDLLGEAEPAWTEATGFAVHLAWHRALFQLDAQGPASALATYDARIAGARVHGLSVLADASALLWRLQLRGVEIGSRWPRLADHWEEQHLEGVRPFFAAHAITALAAAGRPAVARRMLEALAAGEASSAVPEDALLPPFSEALLAFAAGDYAACIDRLTHVRHLAHHCGGSLAQCDLFHLTLTEAALRAPQIHLARALVAERVAQKPASPLNGWLQRRLRTATSTVGGQARLPSPGGDGPDPRNQAASAASPSRVAVAAFAK